MRNVLRYPLALLFAVSLVFTAAASTATAEPAGTVSGTVMLEGKPLAGVEVFLWVGHPRLTCTNAAGEFTFTDVPFDIDLVSATGTGSPQHCDNYRFLAPDGDELLSQFYDGHDGVSLFDAFMVTAADPTFEIAYTPRKAAANERVCSGQLATLEGTPGDDVLIGGPDNDVIVGGGGNDIIKGKGGLDLLCGEGGRDTILGGPDADWISGGPGGDWLNGGFGQDVLLAEQGRDRVKGDGGNDVIYGFGGNDVLSGGTGRDFIKAGKGDDVLKGKDGNDRLVGGLGWDTAYGGPGRDRCSAEVKYSC